MNPEVNIAKDKYNIKLTIPGPDMYEMELACNSSQQYIKWMAACRLASKGKTMADPTYDMEMSGVKTFLSMQSDVKDSSRDDDYNAGDHVSYLLIKMFSSVLFLKSYTPIVIVFIVLELQSSGTFISYLFDKTI